MLGVNLGSLLNGDISVMCCGFLLLGFDVRFGAVFALCRCGFIKFGSSSRVATLWERVARSVNRMSLYMSTQKLSYVPYSVLVLPVPGHYLFSVKAHKSIWLSNLVRESLSVVSMLLFCVQHKNIDLNINLICNKMP